MVIGHEEKQAHEAPFVSSRCLRVLGSLRARPGDAIHKTGLIRTAGVSYFFCIGGTFLRGLRDSFALFVTLFVSSAR